MRRGFTLMEVLAAVCLLSLVAATIIPLTLQVGRRSAHLDQSAEAQAILADLVREGPPPLGIVRDRAPKGWWLQTARMTPQTPGGSAVDHAWFVVRLCRGSEEAPEVVAETLLVRGEDAP